MQATVEWTGEASFLAEAGSGHRVQMDGPPDHGGQNKGPRPMEMLLMGMGGCASFDVMSILQKGRQQVQG
ncbi:MAG: OsmC family protein, partial [Gammaproteobacteria bacterium]|nr:OsmC family protein [Gammaproteobacteria bacterium]